MAAKVDLTGSTVAPQTAGIGATSPLVRHQRRTGFHPHGRFAASILNGPIAGYSGHQAGLAGLAQADPSCRS
jgi:hypothetical protein